MTHEHPLNTESLALDFNGVSITDFAAGDRIELDYGPGLHLEQPAGHLVVGDLRIPVWKKSVPGRFRQWLLRRLLDMGYETL